MKAERKRVLDILVEGTSGELIFKPVKTNKSGLRQLVGESKNPVIKRNVFRQDSKKRVNI